MWALHGKLRPAKLSDHKHCGSRDIMLLVCPMTSQDHVVKGWRDFIGETMVIHHNTKFGGLKHCGIGDIKFLFCQVISQDHMIKGPSYFIVRSPSR